MTTSRDEIVEQLDQRVPATADHDGPAWPLASAHHCPTCARRRAEGFAMVYGRDGYVPPPAPLTPDEATAFLGRFSAHYPQLTAAMERLTS